MSAYYRILSHLRPYRSRFLTGVVFSFLFSVFNGVTLTSLKPIFDVIENGGRNGFQIELSKPEADFIQGREPDIPVYRKWSARLKNRMNQKLSPLPARKLLMWTGILILPVYLLRLVSGIAAQYFITSSGLKAVADIRGQLYRKLHRLPMSHFTRERSGMLVGRVVDDANFIATSLASELKNFITDAFIVITHVAMLFLINAKLMLITMIGVPLVVLPVNYFARKLKKGVKSQQGLSGTLIANLQEMIAGIRVIRAFGMEGQEEQRFSELNRHFTRQVLKNRMNHNYGPSLVEFVSSGVVISLVIFGGFQIVSGAMSAGSFFVFLFTLVILMSPLKHLSGWYSNAAATSAAGERIFQFLAQDEEPDHGTRSHIPDLQNAMEFRNVTFRHPGATKPTLSRISVRIPAGSTVALVGSSGAGKSTMADLVVRFYDVDSGGIFWDGTDIREFRLPELRSRIGVVTQDVFLFNGSVRDNIRVGRPEASEEEILLAVKNAYAWDFISRLPQGLDTVIGERGAMISGGQRQRLAIARALLKDPELLILDEATSALDTESERLVQKALEKLMKNRTVIVIAHRLSTVRNADLIVVLEAGRIAEKGTHKELLKKRGRYAELHSLQFGNRK